MERDNGWLIFAALLVFAMLSQCDLGVDPYRPSLCYNWHEDCQP